MFDNKESVGFLTHRGHLRLTVIAIFGILAQLAIFGAYDNVVATSNNDDDRELDIQCKTGNEDVCLIAACMGHPCVWYQNSSGGIERNFDVAITEYTTPSLDTLDEAIATKVVKVDDGCMESTSNIKLISSSRMDDATSVKNDEDEEDKDDDNNNDSLFAKLLDNDYDTKWEEEGFGSFIQADLGSVQPVCNVGIAWDNGDETSYNFVISTSRDGTTFTDTLRGTSSGITDALEKYKLADADSRFIRITVFGNNDDNNNEDDKAAINEIRVGTSTSGDSQLNKNSSNVQSELSEGSLNSTTKNNNASLSSNSTDITPENYISEITDLMVAEGYEDRLQKQFTDTSLPPSVKDLNIRAASVSSLEIELKGSDLSSPDGLDYSVVDLPTHGVLKSGTDQNRVLYYPHPGYVGSDSFTYKAIDDQGLESALGTVDITIENS